MSRIGKVPSLWLIVAALCALMWALPFVLGYMTGQMPTAWNPGRWAFAFYGALIYGWTLPNFVRSKSGKVLWHICVAIGMLTLIQGQGSGLIAMPFAPWISPVFAALLVLGGIQSLRKSAPWDHRLVEASVPYAIAISLLVGWWSEGVGFNSLPDATALESSICILTALYWVWKNSQLRTAKICNVCLSLLALSAPFIGGMSFLKGMPVDVCLIDAGGIWWGFGSLALVVMAFEVFKGDDKSSVGVKMACILLLLLCCAPLIPTEHQLSLLTWYFPALWLLPCACLRSQAECDQCSFCSKALLIATVILMIGGCVAVFGSIDADAFPLAERSRVLSKWTQICSCFALMAVPFMLMGGWVSLFAKETSHDEPKSGFLLPVIGLVCVVILTFSVICLHSPVPSPMEVKRSGQDAVGARIYAAEGCALCHTQLIRRLPSGKDLQREFERSVNPDLLCRVTEPEDFETLGSREGAAHVGRAAIGPDLSNAVEYVRARLTYENALTEQEELAAQPREWLALHLYHPAEQGFDHTWSICPAMTGLFEMRRHQGSMPSAEALPVQTTAGYEVVPTERGRHLLNYLESLHRPALTPKKGMEQLEHDTRHVDPDYVDRMTGIYAVKVEEKRAALALKKGHDIFLNKCSICHGRDGLGDKINYPPLKGSDWLKEKSNRELLDLILNGLTGPIMVNDQRWDSTMLPPGVTDSRDLAQLITFLRKHFTGVEKPLTEKEVEAMRKTNPESNCIK